MRRSLHIDKSGDLQPTINNPMSIGGKCANCNAQVHAGFGERGGGHVYCNSDCRSEFLDKRCKGE